MDSNQGLFRSQKQVHPENHGGSQETGTASAAKEIKSESVISSSVVKKAVGSDLSSVILGKGPQVHPEKKSDTIV